MAFTIYDADLSGANNSVDTEAFVNLSPSSAIPVGKLAILLGVADLTGGADEANSARMSVTDSKGNTWTRAAEGVRGSGGPLCGGIYYSIITTQIETTDIITLTADSAGLNRGAVLAAFNVDAGIEVIATSYHLAVVGIGLDYSASISSLTNEEHLWIGINAHQGGDGNVDRDAAFNAITRDSNDSWGETSGRWSKGGYLISTGTGETYNGTNNSSGSRQTAAALAAFRETSGAPAEKTQLIIM